MKWDDGLMDTWEDSTPDGTPSFSMDRAYEGGRRSATVPMQWIDLPPAVLPEARFLTQKDQREGLPVLSHLFPELEEWSTVM